MHRLLPLVCLASCGIFGLSSEDQEKLAAYQRNASTYYEGGRFDQALDQVRRGLELEPDDYKLHYIRGWCLLRQSQNDPSILPRAATEFDVTMGLRSDADHGPQARLGYSIVQSKLGIEALRRAETMRQDATRLDITGEELKRREADAAALEAEADEHFTRSEFQFTRLVDTGENMLEANYGLMQTNAWHGNYEAAVRYGQAYLERVAVLQDQIREDLEKTMQAGFERALRIRLNNRLEEESKVRAFLANLHYKHDNYELSVEQLNKVLIMFPDKYNEYYNRGRSLAALGRDTEAKQDFEKFLVMTPLSRENEQVRSALDAVEGLK